ncbi:unnamed protein product [Calypogeia fissa]
MRGSTTSSLSDGKLSSTGIGEKCLAVTLMFSNYKHGNNVLFLEAGKDFVDILLSFLTLPMGGIIKLLSYGRGSHFTTGMLDKEAIFKIYNSVDRMDDEKFCTSKKTLLDPKEASGFGSKLLQTDHSEQQEQSQNGDGDSYYSCGMVPHCVCITKKLGRRCPRHGRKMQTLCKYVEVKGDKSTSSSGGVGKANGTNGETIMGYVKDVGKFFITDNLEIYPASISLALLQTLKVEKMSLLSSLDLFIGMDEILKLLKASLVSSNVLYDVFGRLVRERILQFEERSQFRPKKNNSDMRRLNQALYDCPLQCRHDILQGMPSNCNCIKQSEDKGWSHQDRPISAPKSQRTKPLSIPFVSTKWNSKNALDVPFSAQRSLVRPSSSQNRTKQSYSYKDIHCGNANEEHRVGERMGEMA